MYAATSRAFLNPTGAQLERRDGWLLSFDQAVGPVAGVFLRCAWQSQDALIDGTIEAPALARQVFARTNVFEA